MKKHGAVELLATTQGSIHLHPADVDTDQNFINLAQVILCSSDLATYNQSIMNKTSGIILQEKSNTYYSLAREH